jgi:hypothetical protein
MSKEHKYDVGYKQTNRQGLTYEVITYRNNKDIDVKFQDGLVIEHTKVTKLNQNTIFHPDYPIPKINKTPSEKRLGETRKNKQGRKMTIIAYRGAADIDVQFESKFVVDHTEYKLFERGTICDPFFQSLCGVGYMGMRTSYKGADKYARQYEVWSSMMKRCYNENCKRHTWYEDCIVAEEWHCFANFLKWYNEHYYELPDGMGDLDLDKDMKSHNNKVYGPDTCLLIPAAINRRIYHRITSSSDLPLGVTYDKKTGKYKARGRIDKKDVYFGKYDTIEEAFQRVKLEKENEICKAAELYKPYMPQEVYDAVINYKVEITD